MKIQFLALVLCITRITVGQQSVRHAHPYYVQTFPIKSSPQLSQEFSYQWSGAQNPSSAGKSQNSHSLPSSQEWYISQQNARSLPSSQEWYISQQNARSLPSSQESYISQQNARSLPSSQQWISGQDGRLSLKQPAPVSYQIITITEYSNNGTQERQLTSRLSDPVDISKLFQSAYDTDWYRQPEKSFFEDDYASFFNQRPSENKKVSFGQKSPDSFIKIPKASPPTYPVIGTVTSKTNPKQPNPTNGQVLGKTTTKRTPVVVGAPNTTRSFAFHQFPSSDELNTVWGNTLDGANSEEKTEDTRSASSFRQTKKFVQAALDSHNSYRKKHKVSPLSYNTQIAKVAQAWASKLIGSLARGGRLQHRPNNKYGENLWMGSGYKFSDEEAVRFAVKAWYDEISIYKPYLGREPNMSNFMAWGHFTQVVWKSTAKLGMGIARKNGYIVVVANYDPPGNYKGQFASNVKKP